MKQLWSLISPRDRIEGESIVYTSGENPTEKINAMANIKGDSPIVLPEQDTFGISPFAKAIAKSIASSDASDGLVYAVNGVWGSGKSSAVNLIIHHLSEPIRQQSIVATAFNPWWFSGAEALTASFFQELRATVGKSLDDKARETLASLGRRVSSAGPLLGGLAALMATPAAGAAVAGGATLFEKLTKFDSTVESDHRKLAAALAAQGKKFLIVLDDIDRLGTDDALQIFKLIKSVGRLPNVVYLLAFDRHLAEKMVAERFPAEGASYLEKVIQGAFDLPMPDADDLQQQMLMTVENVMGAPPENKAQRFWNLFYDVVAPLLKTPRDVVRLSNAIRVVWPAIGDDVDRADLLSIEALRLFLPAVHRAVRAHPEMLTGRQAERNHDRQKLEEDYNAVLLSALPVERREYAKQALRRLFPRLDAIWANTWMGGEEHWQRSRLICSTTHFPTYFAFGVTNSAITLDESNALVANAGIEGATAQALRTFLNMPRRRGGTRAALALEELTARAADIAETDIPQFLKDLFGVADEMDVTSDAGRGFGSVGSNENRIHWLLNSLLRDRFELPARSAFVRDASPLSGIKWLISLSGRCKSIRDKRGSKEDQGYENLADDETTEWLFDLSRDRLREAAASGALIDNDQVVSLLYRWRDRSTAEEVRAWTDVQLENDRFVVAVAKDAIQVSWSYGMGGFGSLGDRVSRQSEYIHLEPLSALLNLERFRTRVRSLVARDGLHEADRAVLEHFMATPERDPSI